MTTPAHASRNKQGKEVRKSSYQLPDPPEKSPEDRMTSSRQLAPTGNMHSLIFHLGHEETTIVVADMPLTAAPRLGSSHRRYPDLLVAFGVSPELYRQNRGYIVSEQGKPPDLVLEMASRSTRRNDNGEKREFYAALGVLEYWRFDETDDNASVRLAGERLVEGVYQPLPVVTVDEGVLEGYSPALNLCLRRLNDNLRFYARDSESYLPTIADERARAEAEQRQAGVERRRADAERDRANTAEQQAQEYLRRQQELEALLRERGIDYN